MSDQTKSLTRLFVLYGHRLRVEWDEKQECAVIRRPADATDLEKALERMVKQ